MTVLARLAALALATAPGRRALVAVDGVDASGKTTLADALTAAVAPQREVLRASVDGFHRPRAERYRRGRTSPEGCCRDTFDHAALRERLLVPFRDGGACVTAAFDKVRDRPLAISAVLSGPDALLIVDGVFLERPELDVGWDLVLTCRCRTRWCSAVRPCGTDSTPCRCTDKRYLPAQRMYEAECAPAERADVIIDNDDPHEPVVLRWSA